MGVSSVECHEPHHSGAESGISPKPKDDAHTEHTGNNLEKQHSTEHAAEQHPNNSHRSISEQDRPDHPETIRKVEHTKTSSKSSAEAAETDNSAASHNKHIQENEASHPNSKRYPKVTSTIKRFDKARSTYNNINDVVNVFEEPSRKNIAAVAIDALNLFPPTQIIGSVANQGKIIYETAECVRSTDNAKECIVQGSIRSAENIPYVGPVIGAVHTIKEFAAKAKDAGCSFENMSYNKCIKEPVQQTLDDQPVYRAVRSFFQHDGKSAAYVLLELFLAAVSGERYFKI